jgi:hypothetical protein
MDTAKTGTLLVNTAQHNKLKYNNRDYAHAVLTVLAHKIQKTIGQPRARSFIKIVENNLLPNCPSVTRCNILIAEAIFGPDIGSLKGKTVRRGAERVDIGIVNIPASIMSHYRDIILAGDVMFVSTIPSFVMISRHIKCGTTEMLNNQKSQTILLTIKQSKAIYMHRGFNLTQLLMDGEFEPLCMDLPC